MKLKFLLFYLIFSNCQVLFSQNLKIFEAIGVKLNAPASFEPVYTQELVGSEQFLYWVCNFDGTYNDFCVSGDSIRANWQWDSIGGWRRKDAYRTAYIMQFGLDGRLRWRKGFANVGIYSLASMIRMAVKNRSIYSMQQVTGGTKIGADSIALTDSYKYWVVSKMDEDGNLIWHRLSKPTYSANDAVCEKLLVDDAENIYFVLKTRGIRSTFFDSLHVPVNTAGHILYKFDKNGNPIFAKPLKIEDDTNMDIKDIKLDSKGNINIMLSEGGRNWWSSCNYSTWQTSMFRVDTGGGNQRELWRFQSDDLMWNDQFEQMPNGDFVIVGANRGNLTIGKQKTDKGGCRPANQFVARLTENGELVWIWEDANQQNFSNAIAILRETNGSLVIGGVGQRKNNGKTFDAHILQRFSPFGKLTDSIEMRTWFEEDQYTFNKLLLTKWNQKTMFSFDIDGYGQTNCQLDRENTAVLAEINPNLLQKPFQLPPPSIGIKLSPNPIQNAMLRIEFPPEMTKEKTIRIFNLQGIQVFERTVESSILEIFLDISDIGSAGTYLVQTTSDGQIFTHKLVKIEP